MLEPGTHLVANWSDDRAWSTQSVAPGRQFDRWRDFVNEAHMHWNIPRQRFDRFPAYIRQGRCNGFRMIHLTSDVGGIVGDRGPREIAQDNDAVYSFIYVANGSVRLDFGSDAIDLESGTCALWDTTRPMRFVIGPNLRQVTLSVPRTQLDAVLQRGEHFCGRSLKATVNAPARLFVEHLLSLDRCFGELSPVSATPILDASTQMLAATLESSLQPYDGIHGEGLLRAICNRIRKQLDDEELSTASVAKISGVSERQLYRLFALIGTTPAAWIRKERLKQCRRDLASASSARYTVTQIASRWGFRDVGTFGKIFRREFGVPPSAVKSSKLARGE